VKTRNVHSLHSVILGLAFGVNLLQTAIGRAQTFNVLHAFTGQSDGAAPIAGITIDPAGNLYGTTSAGGDEGFGNVYRLVPSGSTWNFYLLYTFQGFTQQGQDGGSPYARVTFGPDGALYGTTRIGGDGNGCREDHGCGTVFKLQPQFGGTWKETVLYQFGYYDGDHPFYGDVVFDSAGNLYGTTPIGGTNLHGAIYKLTPTNANGSWAESVAYSFSGPDGSTPLSGPSMDAAGNLYGTTSTGGANGWGIVYRLQPSGSSWIESVLHSFQGGSDGITPGSGIVLDQGADLYGATEAGGITGGGTAFELASGAQGVWNMSTLFGFKAAGPQGSYRTLARDNAGNLYGTTAADGAYHEGSVFKLTFSHGAWTYTSLHDFTGGSDGAFPYGVLSFDAGGNIYGTASAGGAYGNGVVFQIMP
jgi:uncharacterized repeat protein (TIGR03803 family)